MRHLFPDETLITGNWVSDGKRVVGDPNCERINWLTRKHLDEKGCHREYGAWEVLYQDPLDGRYWLKFYPQNERHGGGPPSLKNITKENAERDFTSG